MDEDQLKQQLVNPYYAINIDPERLLATLQGDVADRRD
jgi:hypothetical protein